MDHKQVRECDCAACPANCRKDLLVNAMLESQVRTVAKDFDMIDGCHLARLTGFAVNLHDIAETVSGVKTIHQFTQFSSLFLCNNIV